MKSLVARIDVLARKTAPPPQTILVAYGTDPAGWPKPQAGADVIYLTVYTGVERAGDDPAACEVALAEYERRQAVPRGPADAPQDQA